jgi:hypothetical protein
MRKKQNVWKQKKTSMPKVDEEFRILHVLPFVADLLDNFAFSSAASPEKDVSNLGRSDTWEMLTLLDQLPLVVHNRNILFRQVLDRFVFHFPQILGHLRDKA